MISKLKLYYSTKSPFARRVRIALHRQGLDPQLIEIDTDKPTPEFLKTNPVGRVPALSGMEKDKEFVLADSTAILEWLHLKQGQRIWPKDADVQAEVRKASRLCVSLMEEIVGIVGEKRRTALDPEWLRFFAEGVDRGLQVLSPQNFSELPWKHSPLLLTQAGYDLIVLTEYLEYRFEEFDWKLKFPKILSFLEQHRQRNDVAFSAPR